MNTAAHHRLGAQVAQRPDRTSRHPQLAEDNARIFFRQYRARSLRPAAEPAPHHTPYLFLTESRTFMLRKSSSFPGTMSIFVDGELKLPLDSIFPAEMDALRRKSYRLAEIGLQSLSATDTPSRLSNLDWITKIRSLLTLIKVALNYAENKGITHLVIAGHPKYRVIYRYMGLVAFGPERNSKLSNGSLTVPLIFDIRAAQRRSIILNFILFKPHLRNSRTR